MAAPSTMPVARSRPRSRWTPIMSITPGPGDAQAHETGQWAEPDQQRPGAAGRGDVAERVPGEGLAAHDGEDAGHRGDDGDDGADRDCDVDLRAGEETGLEHGRGHLVHAGQPAPAAGPAAAASSAAAAPATTRMRPCTCSTSTWWPYSLVSTSVVTTCSVGPLAARPPAR